MTIQRVEYPPGTGGGGGSAPVGYTHGDQWFLKEAIQVGFGGALGSPIKFKESIATAPLSIRDGIKTTLLDAYKLSPGSAAFNDGVKTKFTDSTAITATTKQPDTLHLPDTFNGTVTSWNVGRSGTPDTDAFGDAWVDSTAVNQGTNHGNENLNIQLSVGNAADNISFLEFDLTRFVNLSSNGTLNLSFNVATAPSIVSNVNITATFSKFVARPFTESTLNFTNRPADGANVVSKSVLVVNADAGTRKTFSLGVSEYSAFMGNWVMVRLTGDNTLVTTFTVFTSRDNATASNRPLLTFDFKR